MKTVLIDADQMMFLKVETLEDIKERCDSFIDRICTFTKTGNFALCFTSKVNKRKVEFSDYKENRKDVKKPTFYKEIKEYLKSEYKITEVEGEEADDIIVYFKRLNPGKYIIASQDKDVLFSTAGVHLNTNYRKFGKLKVDVQEVEKFRSKQLLMGDNTDNIHRLEMTDNIRLRFNLNSNNQMTDSTTDIILDKGYSEGLTYDSIVILCYLLSGKDMDDYFNQIKKVTMGLTFIEKQLEVNSIEVEGYQEMVYVGDFEVKFGKYKGLMISDIFYLDKPYVKWIYHNARDVKLRDRVEVFLEGVGIRYEDNREIKIKIN